MVKVFFRREIFSRSPVKIGIMVEIAPDSKASIILSFFSSSTSMSNMRLG